MGADTRTIGFKYRVIFLTQHRSGRHSTSCANTRSMSYWCLDGALDRTAAPVCNPFPFVHKPNTLDHDRVVVSVGWDSWGKIVVLGDGFGAKAWSETCKRDLSVFHRCWNRLGQHRQRAENVRVPRAGPRSQSDPAPAAQQPDARTSLPRKEL